MNLTDIISLALRNLRQAKVRTVLTMLGVIIGVCAVVIMLAVVAQIFLQSPLMQLVLCGAFIIFSSAAILFQINAIVLGGETNYVSATLSLYVSLYNIFTSLLQILGVLGGDRD